MLTLPQALTFTSRTSEISLNCKVVLKTFQVRNRSSSAQMGSRKGAQIIPPVKTILDIFGIILNLFILYSQAKPRQKKPCQAKPRQVLSSEAKLSQAELGSKAKGSRASCTRAKQS